MKIDTIDAKFPNPKHFNFCLRASSVIVRNTLLVAVLSLGNGVGVALAASDEPTIQEPHSDGLGAAVSDAAITAKVKAKFVSQEIFKNSDIKVTTTNGVVTLEGTATNKEVKSLAGVTAESIDGVKSVDNSLKTPANSKASAEVRDAADKTKRVMSDSWITTQVKSELLADSVAKGINVSVATVHGVVVLKGTVENKDAVEHVKDIAAKVDGVKSVDVTRLIVAAY